MKNHFLIYIFFTFLLIPFGCKKVKNETTTVVKDCTGVYLQYKGEDYHVCNQEKVSSFPHGTKVNATFKRISKCEASANDEIVCAVVHENEGWINVEKIE